MPNVNGIISASAIENVSPGIAPKTRPTIEPAAVAATVVGLSAAGMACANASRQSSL